MCKLVLYNWLCNDPVTHCLHLTDCGLRTLQDCSISQFKRWCVCWGHIEFKHFSVNMQILLQVESSQVYSVCSSCPLLPASGSHYNQIHLVIKCVSLSLVLPFHIGLFENNLGLIEVDLLIVLNYGLF